MSDMPWRFWGRGDLKEGTRLVLAALWRHARSEEREAYLRGRGAPPFVWPSVARLVELVRRCERAIQTDLAALRGAGLIERARVMVGGRMLLGWRLLARPEDDTTEHLEPEDDAGDPAQACTQPRTGMHPQDAEDPARPCTLPRTPVHPEPPQGARPCTPKVHARAPLPRTPVHPEANSEAREEPIHVVAVDLGGHESAHDAAAAAAAATTTNVRPKASRPVELVDGEEPGSAPTSWARQLLLELSQMYSPTLPNGRVDETRRIRTHDRQALLRAERLLAVPLEGLGDDEARAAQRERLRYVLELCSRFAAICRRDAAKARFWGPLMLESTAAAGKTMSRWAMLERDVGVADETDAQAEVARREAAARAEADRQLHEQLYGSTRETPEQREQGRAQREATVERHRQGLEAILGVRLGQTRRKARDVEQEAVDEETALLRRRADLQRQAEELLAKQQAQEAAAARRRALEEAAEQESV